MSKKVLLAGLLGGVVVFVVSSIWHLIPALGQLGVKSLPHEDTVLSALRTSLAEPGFYIFPGIVPGAEAGYAAKYKQGPTGLLVYRPGGEELRFGKLLVNEFIFGLVASFILAWILALTAGSTTYATRVLLVLLITCFAGLIYDLPEWNWYGFPALYTAAHFASWFVSWAVAGLVMAAIVKRPASAVTAP